MSSMGKALGETPGILSAGFYGIQTEAQKQEQLSFRLEEKSKLEVKAEEGGQSAMTSRVKIQRVKRAYTSREEEMVQYGYRATGREERRLVRQIEALLPVLTGLHLL